MSISYEYDPDTRIIYTTVRGAVNTAAFLDYLRSVVNDPQIEPGFIEVVDWEASVNIITHFSELQEFPKMWEAYKRKGCKATLIYAPGKLAFGISRISKAIIDRAQETEEERNFLVLRSKAELDAHLKRLRE